MDETPRAQRPPDDGGEPDCSPTLPAGPGEDGPLSRFTALRAGSLFAGRYEIRARLGGGGAGEVYAALDRVAGQPVALKVLFPRGDEGPQPLARLQRELRIARRSRHDGIVRVHDIGESDGLLYLVMDLLEGETLRQRIARTGRLAPAEAVRILRGILDALGTLHAQGGIHRDVKPANVFLVGDGDTEARVVLLDFGLARAEDELSLTRTGQFVGTPEYVSPEQARGEREIGPASDVYSAGIVLWEMLSGAPPFTGDSEVEVLTAQIRRALPDPRRAMPGVPAGLRHLAAWLMEKDPARRPRDARAAIEALERGRAPFGAGISRWARSRRLRIAAAAVAVGVPLALALFLPVRPRIDEKHGLAAVSLAGIPLRQFDLDGARAVAALPWRAGAIWPRDQLVLLNAPGNALPDRFRTALARADLLTGVVAPLAPRGLLESARGGYPAFFPLYGTAFGGRNLLALPPTSAGTPRFAFSLKQDDFPTILAIVSDQQTELMTPHANNPLGQRLAVFAVLADGTPGPSRVAFPPFDLDLPSPGEPLYYTFLSRGGEALVSVDGERVRIEPAGAPPIVLDAHTGVPVAAKDRDGLSLEVWDRRQREVLQLLLKVGRLRPSDDDATVDQLADSLEAFAAQHPRGATQAGVALARAAEL
ncbi:MAG: serine/threonine protein kinase, partial [Acidobacteria bacterium]|nr:serine/threonine protein kinase [Acidobacteriota bacterium]